MINVIAWKLDPEGASVRLKSRYCVQVFCYIDCIDDAVQMATPVPETSRGSLGWFMVEQSTVPPVPETSRGSLGWFMVVQPREIASWDEVPMRISSREGVSRRPIAEDGCARHSPGVQ